MSLIKITDLTKQLGLSSRTLRYYEQEGLIESTRMPLESYRYYDDSAVQRLRQIMILRKMQIPVREIFRIYENPEIATLVEVFADKIAEIDREVTALSELKDIINTFLREMTAKGIKQISALPLLYEEMERQMELLESQGSHENPAGPFSGNQCDRAQSDSHPGESCPPGHCGQAASPGQPIAGQDSQAAFRRLNRLQERLSPPPDAAILHLPPMRALTSCLVQSPQESDVTGFWHTVQALGLPLGMPGAHERFEYQNGPRSAVDMEFRLGGDDEQFGYGSEEGCLIFYHGAEPDYYAGGVSLGNLSQNGFGVNMGNQPSEDLSKAALHREAIVFRQPCFYDLYQFPGRGGIRDRGYNQVTWIIGPTHLAVIINGEIRYCGTGFPYMSLDLSRTAPGDIIIGSNGQGMKYFRSIRVSQLAHAPKIRLQKEELLMTTKQSNNTIPNIHRLVTDEYGENYWFGGCARYVVECLGETDYDYNFFAGFTGDVFTQ